MMPHTHTPQDDLYQQLHTLLQEQGRSCQEQTLVAQAYSFADASHEGQFRKDAQKYITHPLEVALLLAKLPADTPTVCAASWLIMPKPSA